MNSDDKDLRYIAPPTGRRAPHTGSPRRPTKCPLTAGRKAPRAGCTTASPPRARRCRRRRRTGTHLTSKRRRYSVEPQIRPWQRRIRPAHHQAARTAAPAGEPLQWPEVAAPAPLHRREEERPRHRLPCRRAVTRRSARAAARRDSTRGGGGGARVEGERLSPTRGRRSAHTRSLS
jgi:hypothetical protein